MQATTDESYEAARDRAAARRRAEYAEAAVRFRRAQDTVEVLGLVRKAAKVAQVEAINRLAALTPDCPDEQIGALSLAELDASLALAKAHKSENQADGLLSNARNALDRARRALEETV